MTMPKFQPVGWLGTATHSDDIDGEESVVYCFDQAQANTYQLESEYAIEPHFSEDQLTEAYEAGKRDAILEGWVLVPKVATEEMLVAGRETPCTASDDDWRDDYADVYKSMLTAAPKGEE